jgi:hypothetical protein
LVERGRFEVSHNTSHQDEHEEAILEYYGRKKSAILSLVRSVFLENSCNGCFSSAGAEGIGYAGDLSVLIACLSFELAARIPNSDGYDVHVNIIVQITVGYGLSAMS